MLLVGRRTTADIHLEPDASRAVHVHLEPGVRFVRSACINTNLSDRSSRRGDRSSIPATESEKFHLPVATN
jgi:hypothetical protein